MKRKKNNYFVLLFILVVGLYIGYAILNTSLSIEGVANIDKNTWDVRFENIQIKYGSVEFENNPIVENGTTVNFEVKLNLPGDFCEFTVDAVNNGTIDAMIESVTKTPDLTLEQQKYLNYIIEYQNGEEINKKQLIKSNEFVKLKVRVEFRKDVEPENLPKLVEVLNFKFNLNYEQADDSENGISVKDNGINKVAFTSGDINEYGTIVSIGTEEFYTIGTEEDDVKLLSVMNVTLEDKPKQSLNAGTTAFSSDEHRGEKYSDYNGSIVEKYVNNYSSVIESKGITIKEKRLMTRAELDIFNCIYINGWGSSCSGAPKWIVSSSYWIMTAISENRILSIVAVSSGGFLDMLYSVNNTYGVRPVLVVPKNEIFILDNNSVISE